VLTFNRIDKNKNKKHIFSRSFLLKETEGKKKAEAFAQPVVEALLIETYWII
jgi:hypothetical protein